VEQPSLWEDFRETDTFCFERKLRREGRQAIAGIDEAGRGPLAGPVVAACVILPANCNFACFKDAKAITAATRDQLYAELERIDAAVGIGIGTVAEIDRLNILQASLLAMQRAIADLGRNPDFLLVDGKIPVPSVISQRTLIKGESRSASIAAASIVAKVTRDTLMEDLHQRYPQYNFRLNKGYGTAEHRRILQECGPCEEHRRHFKGVRQEPLLDDPR
jgi:ribonuclease HII